MTLTQAVVSYAIMFFVLLIGMGIALWRYKVSLPKLSHMPAIKFDWRGRLNGWRKVFDGERQTLANGEFWLQILLSTFIALCAGVSFATFMIPYGTGWMAIGLFGSLVLLAALLQYLLT